MFMTLDIKVHKSGLNFESGADIYNFTYITIFNFTQAKCDCEKIFKNIELE